MNKIFPGWVFPLLYVNEETNVGSNVICEQMAIMGLKMHVGTGTKISKTETV